MSLFRRTELSAAWPPTAATADAAGHEPKSPMKAIREKCLDCCVGQPSEIRRCESVNCALWPFRSGLHPYTSARMKSTLQEPDFHQDDGLEPEGA